MNLSKRQKILLGVFLIGLVGLVVDRTVLQPQGGPKAASADAPAPVPEVAARAEDAPADGNSPPRVPLAERLSHLWPDKDDGSVELRDPFSLPAGWSGRARADEEQTPDRARTFARRHRLQAVVVQDQDVRAQVDDNVLIPGQTIDGFTLISVDYRSALFECDGKQVVLELAIK